MSGAAHAQTTNHDPRRFEEMRKNSTGRVPGFDRCVSHPKSVVLDVHLGVSENRLNP